MSVESSIPMSLLSINDIRKKIIGQNSSITQEQADKYAKAVYVRLADKNKKPELKTFFEKNPEYKSFNYDKEGNFKGFETQLIIPLEFDEKAHKKLLETNDKLKEIPIKGTAIYPTLSLNFNRYLKSEIAKAYPSLKNVPIQEDHSRNSRDTIGKITATEYSESTGRVKYSGKLKANHPVTENVQLGYIEHSSIGIRSEKAECSICGEDMGWFHEHIPGFEYEKDDKPVIAELIPRNFVFTHIGMVAFAGVSGATVKAEGEDIPIYESLSNDFIESFSAMYAPYYNEVMESVSKKGSESILPNDELENIKAELEKEKQKTEEYQSELGELRTERTELGKYVEKQKEKDRQALINNVVEAEINLGRLSEDAKKERIVELSEKSVDQLETRFEVLNESLSALGKGKKPKSRSYSGTESSSEEEIEENPRQRPQELQGRARREHQVETLGNTIFGEHYGPTFKTIRILDEYDVRTDKWKNPFKELV